MIKHENGFTLIELTVALVLSSLVLVALMGTFILQSRAYTATRMSTELQNNARTALDTIDAMVSNAGFGVVKSDIWPGNIASGPPFDSAAFCFYTPNPQSTSYLCNPNKNVADTYTTSTMDGTQCKTSGWNGCPPHGTDSLTFVYRLPNYLGTQLVVNPTTVPPKISFNNIYPYIGITPGDVGFIIAPDHGISALVTLNGTVPASSGSVTVPIRSSTSFFNELDTLQKKAAFFNNISGNYGFFQKVNVVHVYVDYADKNHPVLMMSINGGVAIPLADNIEDFQVQFIMDDNKPATNNDIMGSALIPSYPSLTNPYYESTSVNGPQQNPLNIDAIVITIVARSDVPSPNVATPVLTKIADHDTRVSGIPYPVPTLGPLANYQRVIYQRIIQLPNIRTASKLYDNRAL